MKMTAFGKTFIIDKTDKHGKCVIIGLTDNKTGKGKGIFTEPEHIFER